MLPNPSTKQSIAWRPMGVIWVCELKGEPADFKWLCIQRNQCTNRCRKMDVVGKCRKPIWIAVWGLLSLITVKLPIRFSDSTDCRKSGCSKEELLRTPDYFVCSHTWTPVLFSFGIWSVSCGRRFTEHYIWSNSISNSFARTGEILAR